METVTLNTMNGFLKFYLNDIEYLDYLGDYDVDGEIEIQCDNYFVKGRLFFTAGELGDFYNQVSKLSKTLQGSAKFNSSENQLFFLVKIDKLGHILIEGDYRENPHYTTELIFNFEADQTYLGKWLTELKKIVNKYGANISEKK
jgi:hypothetical protein